MLRDHIHRLSILVWSRLRVVSLRQTCKNASQISEPEDGDVPGSGSARASTIRNATIRISGPEQSDTLSGPKSRRRRL